MHIWASPACQTNCLGWRNLQRKLQKLNFTYAREARLQVSDKIQVVSKTRLVLFFYKLQLDTTIWYLQPTFAKHMQIGLLELAQYLKKSADTKQLQLLQPWDSRNFWHFFSTTNNSCTLESLKEIFCRLKIEICTIWCLFNSLGNRKWTGSTSSHACRHITNY